MNLEDHSGYYVTEFSTSTTRVDITCTDNFREFRKISILRKKEQKEDDLKIDTNWVSLRLIEIDGNLSFGEMETIEHENGVIYIDADFGSFSIHSGNSVPKPRIPNQTVQTTSASRRV